MLHHIPMVELLLGKLLARLNPGTRIGFLEPDFRIPLARLARLEATDRPELAPLRVWAFAINHLYLATQISPAVGARSPKPWRPPVAGRSAANGRQAVRTP